ncbi:hypothetical protein D5F01_LYC24561 [Larimichthys crocea]|uniref:Uncharacterized protein n=1 Tax=Larimichthys crocea TaxID=215358 RepID=A0A6G0HE60_LARCR|nr:hypothetical protein D5F01_LYC24561 [Larimichthys crocea]
MPKPQRDKDFPIFHHRVLPLRRKPLDKWSRVSQVRPINDASVSELPLTDEATMEQILAEIKSVASRVNDMDESVGARLDTIDGALHEIKVSVASVESSLSALSPRVTDLEKRVEEVEERLSATEDSHSAHNTCRAAVEKTVKQLLLKIGDLENRGCRKNLKINTLPEKTEGNIPPDNITNFNPCRLPPAGD